MWAIISPTGAILDFFLSEPEAKGRLASGIFCDGYDGIGKIWVPIPIGSKIVRV
jgi:hypothetical protein